MIFFVEMDQSLACHQKVRTQKHAETLIITYYVLIALAIVALAQHNDLHLHICTTFMWLKR
jgi:hypothetical protein